jgi:hypothetical protein
LALGGTATVVSADNVCPTILPADVVAVSEPRLCRDGAAEGNELSICREYRNERHIYLVVFRGGVSPKAVYEHVRTDQRPDMIAQGTARRDLGDRTCKLETPLGVPTGATYSGTGVCEDEQGRPLLCSLFEHAGAREPEAMRYFVYYEPDGSGIRRIDAVSAGTNEHMLEAELAYHLGQALATSVCCRDQAHAYLAHAAALFPDDGAYHAALTAQLGERDTSQDSISAAFSRMLEQSR